MTKAKDKASSKGDSEGPDHIEIEMTIKVKVPKEGWIDYLTKNIDIFMTNYCGYWMRGVRHASEMGWLCWEHGDHRRPHGTEPNYRAAVKAWEANEPLPESWHRLDEAAAIKAYWKGVELWGLSWFEDKGDADTYDVVVQYALLGELRYG
jgi:hypothetical protein